MSETKRKTFTVTVKEELASIKEKRCCKTARAEAENFIKNNTLVDRGAFRCEECVKAFLRGIFLICGTVSDPGKSNHLEMKFANEMNADEICILVREMGIDARVSKRRNSYVVYFKDGNVIFDVLMMMGAQNSAFDQANAQIVKNIRNNVNRVSNCELANMQKTAAATKRVLEAISCLQRDGRFDSLPEKLRYTAALRETNPDLSLGDLAAIHEPPITKSCVNHRLDKIVKIAFGE